MGSTDRCVLSLFDQATCERLGLQERVLVDRGIEARKVAYGRHQSGRGVDAFGGKLVPRRACPLVDFVRNRDAFEHLLIPLEHFVCEYLLGQAVGSTRSRPGTESFIASRSRTLTATVLRYGCGRQCSTTGVNCA